MAAWKSLQNHTSSILKSRTTSIRPLTDNTFSLKNTRFEAPRDLRSRKIQVRFDRLKFDRAIVYFKGERMGEARPVDLIAVAAQTG